MGKKSNIKELTNLMSKSIRHKIGSIVNENELYASRYARDAEVLMKEAQKVLFRENWNKKDKEKIKDLLEKKLLNELTKKDFLDNKKFEIMDKELKIALKEFNLI